MAHGAAQSTGPGFRPSAVELVPPPEPVDVFRKMARLPYCLFLDSALRIPELGRYSFLAADPFHVLSIPADGSDALTALQHLLATWRSGHDAALPPFQGGAAGLLSYDLNRSLERIRGPRHDEFQVPAMALGLYDVVVAFDHLLNRAWLVSQGLPETDEYARRGRAELRLRQFHSFLQDDTAVMEPRVPSPADLLDREQLAPQFATPADRELTSNFAHQAYLDAVRDVIEYIRAGDVFQVNLAQRLLCPALGDAVSLYVRLRERNAAPFAGYFDLGAYQIVSASPERFLGVRQGRVETRPIKGTRQRCHWPEADLFAAGDLLASEKDRAENVMIVDLLRNDLSRVCRPESVCVRELCRLEVYQYVQHLVSVVVGELAAGGGRATCWRGVSGWLDHRCPQGAGHGDHRAAGAHCPRCLLRIARLRWF